MITQPTKEWLKSKGYRTDVSYLSFSPIYKEWQEEQKKKGISYLRPKELKKIPSLFIKQVPTIQPEVSPTFQPEVSRINLDKEIPKSIIKTINFIKEYNKKSPTYESFKFVKGIQEEIAKSGASVALTLMRKGILTSEELTPGLRKAKEIIFGKDPLKAIETRIAEAEIKVKEFGEKYKIPSIEKGALPISALGVGLVLGLDFTGWGGGKKQVAEILAKTSKVTDVARILKEINVADDLIPVYSKAIAKMIKVDDVTKTLNRIGEIQKTTKVAKPIPKELEPLVEEARKYKSAEEFVEAKNKFDFEVPKGGGSKNPATIYQWRLDKQKNPADYETLYELSQYKDNFRFNEVLGKGWTDWKPSLNLTETIKKNEPITIYRVSEQGDIIPGAYVTESLEYAKKHQTAILKGAGKIYSKQVKPSDLFIYGDPHEFLYFPKISSGEYHLELSKSQLTDFYTQVTKGIKEVKPIVKELEPLAQEARKYKSAEEFGNNFIVSSGKVLKTGESTIPISKIPKENIDIAINETRNWANEAKLRGDIQGFNLYQAKKNALMELKENPNFITDFYTQATKGVKEVKLIPKDLEPLAVEARKYKSAEDFYNKLYSERLDLLKKQADLGLEKMKTWTAEEPIEYIKRKNVLETRFIQINNLLNKFKTKEEFIDFYTQATKGIKEVKPEIKPIIPEVKPKIPVVEKLPAEAKPKERQFLQSVSEARPDIPLKIGGQYVPRSTDELAIKARTLIKEDINTAESLARTGIDDKAIATASELLKHYSDEAMKAKSKATSNALYEKASELAHLTAENLTEQGRAVQAASIIGRLTPEGMLRFAAREINKFNEAVEKSKGLFGLKKKIPKLTPGQTEMIEREFKKIEKMPDGTEKAIASKKLFDAIGDLIPSSNLKKAINFWKAGLLTGIKTSGLNTLSNLFHGVSETIKDIPAVAVDSVASLFSKKRTLGLVLKPKWGAVKEGFSKGWRYLKTGYDERNVATKLDWRKVNFGKGKFAKGIQKYEETIFHILGAEDQPFYYGAKARSLQSQAIAQAKNKGLRGSEAKKFIDNLAENPTDKMLKYATNDAEITVFQNQTILGKIARAIQKAPGGEFIVPFGRTPSAVATQFINYTPVGLLRPLGRIIIAIKTKKFDQRLFAQEVGRGLTGTSIMWLGTELFKKGLINLQYPKGEREQKLWQAEGKIPNSIKVGDKYRNVNVLGPAGFVLLAGANFQKALQETGSNFQALSQAMVGGIKSLEEQTFLQGLNSILEALDDPSRFAEGYFKNTAASFIPTIFGDLAKSFDEVERRTSGLLDKIKAKIPGLRQTLEPQITTLGQERLRGGNWLETMIDPSRPSRVLTSNVIQELRRITDLGYKVSPTQLGDKEGYKGLTSEENTALWIKAGELVNSKLNNLFNLKQYKNLPDDEKAKMIEGIIEKGKLNARVQVVMELTEGLSGQELKNKLSELKASGLMIREVFKKYLEFID